MAGVNNWVGVGRWTRDNELRINPNTNKSVLRNTIAIDGGKDSVGNKVTNFINVVMFGNTADFADKYTTKGSKVAVVGSISTSSYQDKDGKKVYTTDVIASSVQFLDSKGDAQPVQQDQQVVGGDGFVNVADNVQAELPFL